MYISDISVIPSFVSSGGNTSGKLEFKAVVISPAQYRSSLAMKYELFDKECKLVARASGASLLSGALLVDAVKPWWPIGMSDSPGYLYKLMVSRGRGSMSMWEKAFLISHNDVKRRKPDVIRSLKERSIRRKQLLR